MVAEVPQTPNAEKPYSSLSQNHLSHLLGSGISQAIIFKRGYETVTGDSPKLGRFSLSFQVPGLLIPHCAEGNFRYQLRPDALPLGKDGKPKKYLYESGSNRFIDTLHAPPEALANSTKPIVIVEGIKKGDALASQDIAPCLAILIIDSCSGALTHKQVALRHPLDEINLKGRRVLVCLDADMATNPFVWLAADKLRARLLAAEADVRFVNIPPGKEGKDGLDDFIAAGGDVTALLKVASPDLPPKPSPKPGRPRNPEPEVDYTGCVFIPSSEGQGYGGFKRALDGLGIEARLNDRTCCYEYRASHPDVVPGYPLGDWMVASDHLEAAIRSVLSERVVLEAPGEKISKRRKYKVGLSMYDEYIKACSPRVDPFLQWLLRLPKWDGVERIESVLQDAFGCDDTELNRWASAYLFRGAVKRTLEPGAKLDEMAILVGKQGIGKSRFLRSLVPFSSLFTDAFSFSMTYKQQLEATLGAVIVEVSELTGLRIREQNACKAYLSMQEDKVRLAYDRRTSHIPRMFLMVGTANDDGTGVLPDDPTGSRRYVVVECKHFNELPNDSGITLQWWAEALKDVQGGTSVHLPRWLHDQQANVNKAHEHPAILLMEDFEAFLATTTLEEGSLAELLNSAIPDLRDDRQAYSSWLTPRRASQVLHKNGWVKVHTRTGNKWRNPRRL